MAGVFSCTLLTDVGVRSRWTRAARSPPADSGRDGDRSPGSRLARWPLRRAARRLRMAVCDRRPSLRRRSRRPGLPLVDAGRGERGPLDGGEPAGRACARGGAGRCAASERLGGDGRTGVSARGRRGSGVGGAGPPCRRRRGEDVAARRAPRGHLLRSSRRRLSGQSRGRRRVPRGRGMPGRTPPVVVGCGRAMAGGGLAHAPFLVHAIVVFAGAAALAWRAGARDEARDIALAVTSGGLVAGAGLLATIAGPGPIAAETSRDGYLRRAGLDRRLVDAYRERFRLRAARYVQWISVPLAVAGTAVADASVAGGFLRRFLASWLTVIAVGVPVGYVTGWLPRIGSSRSGSPCRSARPSVSDGSVAGSAAEAGGGGRSSAGSPGG